MHPINFSPIYPHKTPCRWGNNVVCGGIKIESATCKIDNGICNVVNDTYLIIYGINEIVFGKNNDDFDIHNIVYGKMKFVVEERLSKSGDKSSVLPNNGGNSLALAFLYTTYQTIQKR